MIRELTAFETSDGKLFKNEKAAKEHQQNIIGELLDSLLPNDDRGNVTRTDRHNLLMKQLNDSKLIEKINKLYFALNFTNEEF